MATFPAHPAAGFDRGGTAISDTAVRTGPFRALLALSACVLDTGTAADDTTGLAGLTVPAGATVQARFTSVQLTSGTAVAYR